MPAYFGLTPPRPVTVQNRVNYTASAGQTVFAATYVPGNVDVYKNGVKLKTTGADFTATNGTSVTLAVGASAGDFIEIQSLGVSSPYNYYPKNQADALVNRYIANGVSGNGDAMVVSTTSPQIVSLTNGAEISVIAPGANTVTGPTLQLTGIAAAKPIRTNGNQPIIAGTWGAGQSLTLKYISSSDCYEIIGLDAGFATAAQAAGGSLLNVMLNPAGLTGAFNYTGQQSLTQNGWQKLPGGLIIQWGQFSVPTGSSGTLFSLPMTFPTGVFAATASHYGSSSGSVNVEAVCPNTSQIRITHNVGSTAGVAAIIIGY